MVLDTLFSEWLEKWPFFINGIISALFGTAVGYLIGSWRERNRERVRMTIKLHQDSHETEMKVFHHVGAMISFAEGRTTVRQSEQYLTNMGNLLDLETPTAQLYIETVNYLPNLKPVAAQMRRAFMNLGPALDAKIHPSSPDWHEQRHEHHIKIRRPH